MKSFPCVIRILALFLSLALALPVSPAAHPELVEGERLPLNTLRVMSPIDAGMEEQLVRKLGYPAAQSPAAGLEERRSTRRSFLTGAAVGAVLGITGLEVGRRTVYKAGLSKMSTPVLSIEPARMPEEALEIPAVVNNPVTVLLPARSISSEGLILKLPAAFGGNFVLARVSWDLEGNGGKINVGGTVGGLVKSDGTVEIRLRPSLEQRPWPPGGWMVARERAITVYGTREDYEGEHAKNALLHLEITKVQQDGSATVRITQVRWPPQEVVPMKSAGRSSGGLEEAQRTGAEGIRWAGDLETVQAIAGYPHRIFLPLHLYVPGLERDRLNGSLELVLVVQSNGQKWEFQMPEGKRGLFDGLHGPHRSNHRLGVDLPEGFWPLLEQRGHLQYWFRYRLKGQPEWKDTSTLPPEQKGIGEIVYQPRWLFESAMYTVNVKAWGSFDAVRKRLPDLDRLGVKVLLLQGIHPGYTNFEIDDFEAAAPKLGGEKELDRLIQEAKAKGFKILIPFVPNHASPQNRWLQEKDYLFTKVSKPDEIPQGKTVTVTVRGQPVTFLRGNVYNPWVPPHGEIPEGFGPGTVQFDLWDQGKRRELADLWIKVLGSWVNRGIDGFYADTGHSLNFIAPGWLEEIRRGLQANHPGTVFGCEAHWGQAEGFIRQGMSFAQDYFLYDDWLRALIYGYKGLDPQHRGVYRDAKGLMAFLRAQPPEVLQQKLTFEANHDEDSVALHLQWSNIPESLKLRAMKAFSTLLVLGIPGIPLLNNGQESAKLERLTVTGHTLEYDKKYDLGRAPNAPEERFDPFVDQSPKAEEVRRHFARLLEIRRNNEAFWWGPGTQFPETEDSHTFASYRAAGEKRAMVVVNLDRSVHDPERIANVRLDLSKFGLSREERLRIRRALEALEQAPPDFRPHNWTFNPEDAVTPTLSLQFKPFQQFVLEWQAPSGTKAGLEEERWVWRSGSWGPISFEIRKLPEGDRLSLQKQVDQFLLGQSARLIGELEESSLIKTQRYGIPSLIATLRQQLDGNPESAVERISFALDWAGVLKEKLYPEGIRQIDADDLFFDLFQKGIPLAAEAAQSDEEFRENLKSLGRFLVDLHGRSPQDLRPHFATVVGPMLSYYDGFTPAQRPGTPQQFSDDLALFKVLAPAELDLKKVSGVPTAGLEEQLGVKLLADQLDAFLSAISSLIFLIKKHDRDSLVVGIHLTEPIMKILVPSMEPRKAIQALKDLEHRAEEAIKAKGNTGPMALLILRELQTQLRKNPSRSLLEERLLEDVSRVLRSPEAFTFHPVVTTIVSMDSPRTIRLPVFHLGQVVREPDIEPFINFVYGSYPPGRAMGNSERNVEAQKLASALADAVADEVASSGPYDGSAETVRRIVARLRATASLKEARRKGMMRFSYELSVAWYTAGPVEGKKRSFLETLKTLRSDNQKLREQLNQAGVGLDQIVRFYWGENAASPVLSEQQKLLFVLADSIFSLLGTYHRTGLPVENETLLDDIVAGTGPIARELGDWFSVERINRSAALAFIQRARDVIADPSKTSAGMEEERQVALGNMLRERLEGWESLSPRLKAVVFGPSHANGPYGKAIRILAGLEERVFIDERADPTRAVVQILSLPERISVLRYVGTLKEAGNFNKLARLAGLEEAVQESVDPAFLKDQLQRILSAMGVPEDILQTGLEEFAAGLEEVGRAA